MLIHKLTSLLLFTAEGNPASAVQKTQIPPLAVSLFPLRRARTYARTYGRPATPPPPPPPIPFPASCPPPCRYLTGIRLDFRRRAAANRNFLCQIGRISRSEKKREANPLVGSPAGTRGVRASSSSGQIQQTKEAFPSSPRQPVPLFDNGCHGGSFSIHNSVNTSGRSRE